MHFSKSTITVCRLLFEEHRSGRPSSSHHHTVHTMNSTMTTSSFQSPSFKLPDNPGRSLLARKKQIHRNWATHPRSRQLLLKPLQAALGPGATSDPNRKVPFVPSSPVSNLIQEFYSSLNDKDSKRLEKLIAPDCVIEDTAYYRPLDAKNTHTFFKRMTEAMGKHVEFAIDEVCEGVQPTVAVMWHLEWNAKIIPFTKGCSFYICSRNGGAVLIKKAHIFVESPLKPGNFALEILEIVISLFDKFPKLAEDFLKNPDAVVRPFLKLYKFVVELLIPLILAYCIRFWTYVVQALTMVRNILHNMIKRFI